MSGIGGVVPPTFACAADTAPCDGVAVACDDAADCGAQRCCGEFNASTGYVAVDCRASCNGTAPNGDTFVELCDRNAKPDTCSGGKRCQPSGSLTGYSICK